MQGTGSIISFLKEQLKPLIDAISERDDFTIMRILETYCLRMQNSELLTSAIIRQVSHSLDEFILNLDLNQQSIKDILVLINQSELLEVPEKLLACFDLDSNEQSTSNSLNAWKETIGAPYLELIEYLKYDK